MSPRRNGESSMNRRSTLVRYCDLGVVLAGIALAIAGCGRLKATDAFNALQIVQVQVLDDPDNCAVPGAATSLFRTSGTLDVYMPDNSYPPYELPVLLANNLASVGASPAEEMNNITVTHFSVELSAPGMTWGPSCPASFDSETFTTQLTPGSTAGHMVTLITSYHSQCLLAALAPQRGEPPRFVVVTAKIWAKGRHGGTNIESAPFVYSITVCTGCLQMSYAGDLAAYRYPADTPYCEDLYGTNTYRGANCLPPGQDEPILCCAVKAQVNDVETPIVVCPGEFSGKNTTSTSTSTSTSTGP
jgi:hypothetical protein